MHKLLRCGASAVLVAALAFVTPAARAQDATGDPVPTFGVNGTAQIDIGTGEANVVDALADGEGRTLVLDVASVGDTGPTAAMQIHLVAFRSDGQLDPEFATSGTWTADVPGSHVRGAVTVDAAGRLVVIAYQTDGFESRTVRAWRLLPTGTVDASFGQSGSAVTILNVEPTSIGPDGWLRAFPGAAGGVVVASSDGLLRLDDGGGIVGSFGQSGTVLLPSGWTATAAAQRPDGSLALVVRSSGDATRRLDLYDATGARDAAFGVNGSVDLGSGYLPSAMDADQSGRLVVANDGHLVRVLTDGSLDPAFNGATGLTLCPSALTPRLAADDDRIVVVDDGPSMHLTIFDDPGLLAGTAADPTPDPRCSVVPFRVTDYAVFNPGPTVVLPAAGNPASVVVAWHSSPTPNGGRDITVAALASDGSPIGSFGTAGLSAVDVGTGSSDVVGAAAEDASGRLLIAGGTGRRGATLPTPGRGFVLRLLDDGTPDPTFGSNGRVVLRSLGAVDQLSVAVDGSMVLLTSTGAGRALVRLLANGDVDPAFGAGGIVTPIPLPAPDDVVDWALAMDGSTIFVGATYRFVQSEGPRMRVVTLDAATAAPVSRIGPSPLVEVADALNTLTLIPVGERLYLEGARTSSDTGLICFTGTGLPCDDVGTAGSVNWSGRFFDVVLDGGQLVGTTGYTVVRRGLDGSFISESPSPVGDSTSSALAVHPDHSATLVRAKSSVTWEVSQVLPNGELDPAFGDSGIRLEGFEPALVTTSPVHIAAQRGGRVALIGSSPDVVVRQLDLATQRPYPTLSISDATATESSGRLTFHVSLDPPSPIPVHVRFDTHWVTADPSDLRSAPNDGEEGPTTEFWDHVIPAGASGTDVSFLLEDDQVPEPDETVDLAITMSTSARVDRAVARGTIINDDDAVGLVPGMPRDVAITKAGQGFLTATWGDPYVGGDRGFVMVATRAGQVVGVQVVAPEADYDLTHSSSIRVPPSDQPHQVWVFAFNDYGLGRGRASRGTAVPQGDAPGTPSAPQITWVNPSGGFIEVLWAPGDDNGSPITAYSVVAVDPNGHVAAWENVAADVRRLSLTGLREGVEYQVAVLPWNAVGLGQPVEVGPYALNRQGWPAQVPDVPAFVLLSPTSDGGTVTWGPAEDNGAPITAYSVVAVQDGKVVAWVNTGPDDRSRRIGGLPANHPTTFFVFGWNRIGNGQPGSPKSPPA